jgi:hypothetical protein
MPHPVMSKRTVLVIASAVLVTGYLFVRLLGLEQRAAALSRRVGIPSAADASGSTESVHGGATPDFEQRLVALERELDALERHATAFDPASGTHAKDQAPASNVASAKISEAAILSVVERETARLRDVQLEWSRPRWLEAQRQTLDVFARQYGLSPEQSAGLSTALQREVDVMISQLRRTELAEDPDLAAQELSRLLEETDAHAQKLLNPSQLAAWQQGRAFARKVLFPWLP